MTGRRKLREEVLYGVKLLQTVRTAWHVWTLRSVRAGSGSGERVRLERCVGGEQSLAGPLWHCELGGGDMLPGIYGHSAGHPVHVGHSQGHVKCLSF